MKCDPASPPRNARKITLCPHPSENPTVVRNVSQTATGKSLSLREDPRISAMFCSQSAKGFHDTVFFVDPLAVASVGKRTPKGKFRLSFFPLRPCRGARLPRFDLLVPSSLDPFGLAPLCPPHRDPVQIDGRLSFSIPRFCYIPNRETAGKPLQHRVPVYRSNSCCPSFLVLCLISSSPARRPHQSLSTPLEKSPDTFFCHRYGEGLKSLTPWPLEMDP